MTNKEQLIKGADISKCFFSRYDENEKIYICDLMDFDEHYFNCDKNPNCYFKQQARKTQECERMKYYLSKIRQDELSRLDVEWDEYITECTSTDYSNILTYVEYALGERKDD